MDAHKRRGVLSSMFHSPEAIEFERTNTLARSRLDNNNDMLTRSPDSDPPDLVPIYWLTAMRLLTWVSSDGNASNSSGVR